MSIPTHMSLVGFIASTPDLRFGTTGTPRFHARIGCEHYRKEVALQIEVSKPDIHQGLEGTVAVKLSMPDGLLSTLSEQFLEIASGGLLADRGRLDTTKHSIVIAEACQRSPAATRGLLEVDVTERTDWSARPRHERSPALRGGARHCLPLRLQPRKDIRSGEPKSTDDLGRTRTLAVGAPVPDRCNRDFEVLGQSLDRQQRLQAAEFSLGLHEAQVCRWIRERPWTSKPLHDDLGKRSREG